jgi:hypothetical protein
MTPLHPRWAEFVERLSGPTRCNVNQIEERKVWTCEHDMRGAEFVLKSMDGIDVENSLNFLRRFAQCDCQILFDLESAMARYFATEVRSYLDSDMTNKPPDDDENNLVSKLKKSSAMRSLSMEYEMGAILQEHGWNVLQSPYYTDPKEKKLREIDVVGMQRWGITGDSGGNDFINLQLVVECKQAKKFHLLFGPDTGLLKHTADMIEKVWLGDEVSKHLVDNVLDNKKLTANEIDCLRERFRALAAPDGQYRHPGIDIRPISAPFRAVSFRETDTRTDRTGKKAVLWGSIMAVKSAIESQHTSSLEWHLENLDWAVRRVVRDREELGIDLNGSLDVDFLASIRNLNVFHPVLVIDSSLWKAESGDLKAIDWCRLKISTLSGKAWWCDVVHGPKFTGYATAVTKHYSDYFAKKQATRLGI